jgi:hypothetical protein
MAAAGARSQQLATQSTDYRGALPCLVTQFTVLKYLRSLRSAPVHPR